MYEYDALDQWAKCGLTGSRDLRAAAKEGKIIEWILKEMQS